MANAGEIARTYFERMSSGDARGAFDLFADDVRYRVIGTTPISKEAIGRRAVVDEIIRPFTSRLRDGQFEFVLDEVIGGEGDTAVALAHSIATATSGAPYNNEYAIVFRVAGDRITSLTEYLDTALVETAVFGRELRDA